VIISHAHVDHFGAARRITENSAADIWIADLGYPWIVGFNDWWEGRQDFYKDDFLPKAGIPADFVEIIVSYFYGITSLAASVPKSRVKVFKAGDSLPMGRRSWEVVHTPGHASMQTCFYQADTRQFLSADMLLPRAPTPIVEKPPEGQTRIPALPQFLESLETVEVLDIDRVYPGHGEPFGNHRTLIQNQRERIESRKNECYSLIQSGRHTPFEILEKMYAHYPLQLRLPGLWMLIGYLDLLAAEGRVEVSEKKGVWWYDDK
jgi:glyoxylase-like metal-dependent hydrolase (beta-lactamase superfamily II)